MKKFIWVTITFLFVISLVLASCQATTEDEDQEGTTIIGEVTETETEEEEEAVDTGPKMVTDSLGRTVQEPQYGGTLIVVTSAWVIQSLDPVNIGIEEITAMQYGRLIGPDWMTSPQGTGENVFQNRDPEPALFIGELAESFEMTSIDTVIIKLRKGIHWQNVPPVNGREFTADDVVETCKRWRTDVRHFHGETAESIQAWIDSESEENPTKLAEWLAELKEHGVDAVADGVGTYTYYKIDNYTVALRHYWGFGQMNIASSWYYIWPHEMWETYEDLSSLQAQCGTGPFRIVDHVSDSSITLERNPNYWRMDPLHPENRLPYVEQVRALVIEDTATQLAGLRTHKIDRMSVAWNKAEGLRETNPELMSNMKVPSTANIVFVRTDIPPFNNKLVRHAAMLAINQEEMLNDYYLGDALMFNWPISPVFATAYMPLEEFDQVAQELFEYHPDKAREYLAEAGYPNGFETSLTVAPYPHNTEVALQVQSYLADVGIDITIETPEPTTYTSIHETQEYEHMLHNFASVDRLTNPWSVQHDGWRGALAERGNIGRVRDDVAFELYDRYQLTEDPDEAVAIHQEQTRRSAELRWEIVLPMPYDHTFWQPWVMRFSGEVSRAHWDAMGMNHLVQYIWLDQDLKYQITGQR